MGRKDFPTKDADAFSSFVQGRAFFQAYLGTGQGDELTQARDRFAAAAVRDPEFDIAKLYLAVTQTELRDSDAAISALEELIKKKRYVPEAHVQLAYAHVKRYKDADYATAEQELDKAASVSKESGRTDLIDLIEAYRVFLLAVRGGRAKDTLEKKREYLNKAVKLGGVLLRPSSSRSKIPDQRAAVQFEVDNAMGIAFLWLGELFHTEPDAPQWWDKAEEYLNAALALRPNSVRPLQNLGLLYMLRGDRTAGEPTRAKLFYAQAESYVERSLKLNPFDQYPYFQQALLALKTSQWSTAAKSVESGIKQKGAVSPEKWASVQEAIRAEDASKVRTLR
jgi:tetratricopeptide (TPR) repeat protein